MMVIKFGTWFLAVLLFSSNVYAKCLNKCQPASKKLVSKNIGDLINENGRINASINNVPLGDILNELKEKTGTEIKVYDPALLKSRVSAVLKQMSLEESIQIILKDFSYALYPSDNGYIAIVLSSNLMSMTKISVFTPHLNSLQSNVLSISKDETETQPSKNVSAPKSLNEFLPISLGELRIEPDVEQNLDNLELEQRREEALVQRALDALDSIHQHLYKDALTQLVGINDPRATEALIDATKKETDRIKAVDALWQHTVNLQFSDNTSIDAMRQLSTDEDVSISSFALDALHEYEQYQKLD